MPPSVAPRDQPSKLHYLHKQRPRLSLTLTPRTPTMKSSIVLTSFALVLAAASAASVPSKQSMLAAKLSQPGLLAALGRRAASRQGAPDRFARAASAFRSMVERKKQLKAQTSLRQVVLPIDGDGTYDMCDTAGEKIIDDSAPCIGCLLDDEECPSDCCASISGPRTNQIILCEVGKCCVRLMLSNDADAVVLSAEPLSAGSREPDYSCADLEESTKCDMCSMVYPEGLEEPALTCPYEMPMYSKIWDGTAECATGSATASEGSMSEGTSTSEEGEIVPTTTTGDAKCTCTCTAV